MGGLASLMPVNGRRFRLELRTPGGVLLREVVEWWGGNWQARLNALESLQFTVAGDVEYRDLLVYPNEVWLYRGGEADAWQKFVIVQRSDGLEVNSWISLTCESLQGQLGREVVASYTPSAATVEAMVTYLLANFQTNAAPITVGDIDSEIGDVVGSFKWENTTIAECLGDLFRLVGGHYWVTVDRELNFKRVRGHRLGHWVKQNHNMPTIRRHTDFRELKTRVVGFGRGGSYSTRPVVTVNDGPAQAEYGVIPKIIQETNVRSSGTLTLIAEAELDVMKAPRVNYEIGMLDFSALDGGVDYNFDANGLELGTEVQLISPGMGIDLVTQISFVGRTLDVDARVQVQLSDPMSGTPDWGGSTGIGVSPRRAVLGGLVDAVAEIKKDLKAALSAVGVMESVEELVADEIGDAIEDMVTWDPATDTGSLPTDLVDILNDTYDPGDPGTGDEIIDEIMRRLLEAFHAETVDSEALIDEIAEQLGTAGGATDEPVVVSRGVGAVGTEAQFAREDHEHALSETVMALPAIPVDGDFKLVRFEGQLWYAEVGDSRWWPLVKPTTTTGIP